MSYHDRIMNIQAPHECNDVWRAGYVWAISQAAAPVALEADAEIREVSQERDKLLAERRNWPESLLATAVELDEYLERAEKAEAENEELRKTLDHLQKQIL